MDTSDHELFLHSFKDPVANYFTSNKETLYIFIVNLN